MFYDSVLGFQWITQPNQFLVCSAIGDINGDGLLDNVFLTGNKTPNSPFIQNIALIIQDGRTGLFIRVPLKTNEGYNPRLFSGDFNNDGVKDILISIDSGGSGGMMYHYIYSDMNNMVKLIFDYDIFNQQYRYSVTYKDYYKVEVINLTDGTVYLVDISLRGSDYLSEIYNADGHLKSPIEGFVNPLSGLYPVDFDSNGVYELLAYQRVAGRYNADSLGYIQTVLKWDKNQFIISDQYLAVFGTKL